MKRLLIITGLIVGLTFSAPAVHAAYDPLNGACTTNAQSGNSSSTPANNPYNSPICKQFRAQLNDPNSNPIAGPKGVLQTITNVMAMITGIVAVIMIVVSGINFMTAGGNIAGQRAGDNPSKAKKARAQLSAALIGLIIVALSWSILSFIIQKFVQ